MKYLKLFESYGKIDIPDDLVEWCIELIGSQPFKIYNVSDIPKELIDLSNRC